MTDRVDILEAQIAAAYDINRTLHIQIAELDLQLIAAVVLRDHPDALFLSVGESDQTDSGAHVPHGWIDAAGELHDLDCEDELSSPCYDLGDDNASVWQPFAVPILGAPGPSGKRPEIELRFDLRKIAAHTFNTD